jgi:hypothetical protein
VKFRLLETDSLETFFVASKSTLLLPSHHFLGGAAFTSNYRNFALAKEVVPDVIVRSRTLKAGKHRAKVLDFCALDC